MGGHVALTSTRISDQRDLTQEADIVRWRHIVFEGACLKSHRSWSEMMQLKPSSPEIQETWRAGRSRKAQVATVGIPPRPVSCWMSLRNVCVGPPERLWPRRAPLHAPLRLPLGAGCTPPLELAIRWRLGLCLMEGCRSGVCDFCELTILWIQFIRHSGSNLEFYFILLIRMLVMLVLNCLWSN